MTAELHNTNVNMEGLLEVLGKNLYSTPNVAIRELVQNAHDACIRRKLESNFAEDLKIRISVDNKHKLLYIEDNGSGLTYEEVLEFLATIGSGYTRLLRNQTETEEMIGYFGLGFLSAYVIASKVDVWTTSYKDPAKTWHFSSKGGKQFSIDEAVTGTIGTKVRLKISDNYHELCSTAVLESLLRKYCCLLPIKIYLGDNDFPVNDLQVPWLLRSEVSELRIKNQQMDFASIFEDNFKPICVIPLPYNEDLKVNGLIWIQDSSGFSTSDYRNVSVFVRNMFITHEGRDLLPLWAGFVGCIVESHSLTPTASREDIQKDSAFEDLKEYLTSMLINGLKHLSQYEPENWRRILNRHNQALMGAAVNDDTLFHLLKDELKVPTSSGEMMMPNLTKQGEGKIYVRLEEKNNYEDVLFRARMIPVVSGYLFAAISFCQKYAELHQSKLVQLGTREGDNELFEEVQPSEFEYRRLKKLLQKPGDVLLFSRFNPEHVPMIIIEDKDAILKNKMEQEGVDKRIGLAALSLAKLHTNKIDESQKRKLFINLDSPLISKLISDDIEESKAIHLAELLRSFIVTICHDASNEELNFSKELEKFSHSLMAIL